MLYSQKYILRPEYWGYIAGTPALGGRVFLHVPFESIYNYIRETTQNIGGFAPKSIWRGLNLADFES